MKALWYTFVFIVGYVLTGKCDMADAKDVYHFAKTMLCVEKVKKNQII